MAWLLAQGCQIVVVTLGPDGAVFTSFSDGVLGRYRLPRSYRSIPPGPAIALSVG
jgi:sugar/nucleoside kinase (ribokinase family)